MFYRFVEFVEENVDYRLLKRRRQVGAVFLDKVWIHLQIVAEGIEERGFQAAETVIESRDVGLGKPEGGGISFGGEAVDMRAAGIGEPHHFSTFVEGFAGCVVNCLTDDFHIVVVPDQDQLGVPSRYQKGQEGEVWHPVVGLTAHEMAQHVAVEMIDFDQGNPQSERHPFGERGAYEQRAEQAGATGESYGVEVAAGDSRPADCRVNYRDNVLLVGAGGQFGYYAAVLFVYALGCYDVRQQQSVADYGRGSVVTG